MTIDQTNIIDFIAVSPNGDEVFLVIADHYEWKENDKEHMLLLQEKINSYLRFIESGEIYSKYHQAKEKKFVINIKGKFLPNNEARWFFTKVENILEEAGYRFLFEHFAKELDDSGPLFKA